MQVRTVCSLSFELNNRTLNMFIRIEEIHTYKASCEIKRRTDREIKVPVARARLLL
jgi:hypothetical protein